MSEKKQEDFFLSLKDAGQKAINGGVPGAVAMIAQIFTLMWLRTIMNYQYRYGTSIGHTIRTLYVQGGVLRFYKGFGPAMLQGPLSRFGDTAANSGMLALLNDFESTKNLNVGIKTMAASLCAGIFRIGLMPIDTVKTILQVEGKEGLSILRMKMRNHGPSVFFYGSMGAAAATMVGHYPWFFTHNYLENKIPKPDGKWEKLARRGAIGFTASVVSDTVSNSLRVLKTYRQTHSERLTYMQSFKNVIQTEGISGLLGRGLKTRILANGLQGCLFTIVWKGLEEKMTMLK